MSTVDHFVLGDYNAVCFECGRKKKASTLVKNWKGYYVCPDHNEPRHPQDFVGTQPAQQQVPWAQSPGDLFVAPFPEPPPFDPNTDIP